jgi:glycosyltransferase involved in cell wall biosynthesis
VWEKQDVFMESNKYAIIIPVYNHEAKVADVIQKALKLGCPIYVVDDGSTDSSYEKIKNIPEIFILRHPNNMGKGAALMTGFSAASSAAEWAVTIDADGQHDPDDIPRLFSAVTPGKRAVVIGCRQGMDHDHVPWSSRFGRGFSNFWVWVSGGPAVKDSQSGFRLYPLPEVLSWPVMSRRFQFEVEVLVQARRHSMPVLEAPVSVIYAPKNERVSHYRGTIDFLRNSATFTRLIFQRLVIKPMLRFKKRP